ncbi:DsbA family protein [Niabella ginsengisoli]|uniref:DsbA family protein n=1 Tax=Niabella ginsengisoli TaxID=522298 RepID=A0ABS9SPN9_9BACT|nr:DsbA family protein [Niabella ginsengisoli]MCH5600305.1 DsbA family protein [Niabella ginsengisoli]
MTFYYCYDAQCGWCFGFSKVITQFADLYKDKFQFEVLSGGMIPKEGAKPVKAMAGYIGDAYKKVEELAGVRFGADYLWHIQNPDESDWFPESLTPAIALCVFKEYWPEQQVYIAADFQKALFEEGRDLSDGEAYRHLLEKYDIPADEFYQKFSDASYIDKAKHEFALCQQLQVTGFPKLLLQVNDTKFYLLAEGYTPLNTLNARLENILKELEAA